ncbi:hypothetical protein MWU58_02880 [Flavobacteriaceae bacterium S0825]|uniref:hypothetical protein n=1 Tax=Gaetbulibacter sp. S0825 TaxID=2720084 RepID=UPI00142F8E40|nr:hypothetical protein [Gaetbulibacter sp. S0825]MCK0108223.1 hypothetical protein [Flavobacteriaceae bacterium S0825]NIX63859.1 hypothetical protein [Gaetbulibacter sp. S0825]
MKEVTERQTKTIKALVDIGLKFLFGIAALVAFFIILNKILRTECDWQDKGILVALEAILSFTVYKVFAHYFPNGNSKE